MALFQRHKLERNGNGYTIILYMDPGLAEFAEEFGKNNNGSQERLADSVRKYVKERFPNLKVTAAKVMIGSMLAASVPLGGAAFAAEDTGAVTVEAEAQVAAELNDVVGTKYESSVKMLTALGIVDGFEDGTYRPNEGMTRAQFAKFAVYAAGYGDTAEILGGQTTGFTDVPATHWASKYVLVAKERGLMEGVGGGAFNPDAQITYEQAIAVLQRVQGYSDENLVGTWPTNHVIQATQQGIIGNTDFKVGVKATRGDVAILLRNVLEKPLVKYNTDTKRFENLTDDQTLLDQVYDDSLKPAVVYDAKSLLKGYTTTGPDTVSLEDVQLTLVGAKSLKEILGNEISYMKVSDNHYLIVNKQDPDKVFTGKLKEASTKFGDNGIQVQFDGQTTKYAKATNFVFYKNGKRITDTNDMTVSNTETVTVYLDKDNKIRFVSVSDFEPAFVLNEVASPTQFLNGSITGTDLSGPVYYTINKDKPVNVKRNGVTASLADLSKEDVIYVARQGQDVINIEAFSNIVTGDVTMLKSGTGKYVQVDGVDYQISDGAVDDSDEIAEYTVGKKYSLVLDKDGKIIKRFTPVGEDPTKVTGMFLGAENIGKVEDGRVVYYDSITVLTTNGQEKTYLVQKNDEIESNVDADGDLTFNGVEIANSADETANPADVVTITLNADGNVVGVSAISQGINGANFTATGVTIDKVTATDIKIGATTYRLADNLVVFDQKNKRIIPKDQLSAGYQISYKLGTNNIYVEKIVVTGGTPAVGAAEPVTGLFKGTYSETVNVNGTSQTKHYVTLLVGGQERDFEVAAANTIGLDANAENTVITILDKNDSDKKYDTVYQTIRFGQADDATPVSTPLEFTTTSNFTVDREAFTFTQGAAKYIVEPDTKVYLITEDDDGNPVVSTSDFSAINSINKTSGAEVTVVAKVNEDGNEDLTYGDFTRADSVVVNQTTIPATPAE